MKTALGAQRIVLCGLRPPMTTSGANPHPRGIEENFRCPVTIVVLSREMKFLLCGNSISRHLSRSDDRSVKSVTDETYRRDIPPVVPTDDFLRKR